jgi:hypothetical protein
VMGRTIFLRQQGVARVLAGVLAESEGPVTDVLLSSFSRNYAVSLYADAIDSYGWYNTRLRR